MAFFESPVNLYTLELSPPQPSTLWGLSESALEDLCLPDDKNNAMFIAEPPTNIIQRTLKRSANYIDGPYHDTQFFQNDDRGIIPPHNQEIQRNPVCYEPTQFKSHNRASSETPGGYVNDVPFSILARMGVAKPGEGTSLVGNYDDQTVNDSVTVDELRQVSNENQGIIHRPDILIQPLSVDNDIQMEPGDYEAPHNQIPSASTMQSAVVDDIPHQLLIQMGLTKPVERTDVKGNSKRQLRNNTEGKNRVISKDQGILRRDVRNQPLLAGNNEIQTNSRAPQYVKLPPHSTSIFPGGDVNNGIPYHLLVQLGLAKPGQETCGRIGLVENDIVTVNNGNNKVFKGNREITENEAKNHFSNVSEPCAERVSTHLEKKNSEACPASHGAEGKSNLNVLQPRKSLESQSSLSQLFLSDDVPEENIRPSSVPAKSTESFCVSKTENDNVRCKANGNDGNEEGNKDRANNGNKICISVENQEKLGGTGDGVNDSKNLESQSSLSQLFLSQESGLSHYWDQMACYGNEAPPCDEPDEVLEVSPANDEDDVQADTDICEKLPGTEASEDTVGVDRNVQPFVIRGCEPKMFDTSVKRKEDNPWKTEVRQGVLEPTEEITNRDKREMEEIPMIVSPYFPNEKNYPIQDDQRTSLHAKPVSQDSPTTSSSQDIFRRIFEYEAGEELKLCKNFFKQCSDLKTDSGRKKTRTSKKFKQGDYGKITNYFPVVKTSGSDGASESVCVNNKSNIIQNEERDSTDVIATPAKFQRASTVDSVGGSKKRKNDQLKHNEVCKISRKMDLYERGSGVDGNGSHDFVSFEDYGEKSAQHQTTSKHVFRDLPPGTFQSMSQLKPVGFDSKISDSTQNVIAPHSSKILEATKNQAVTIDFRRTASEHANHHREIAIMEERKVEQTALRMESSGDLFEIGFTLCYNAKFSVLNRPERAERKSHHPAGIMSRVEFCDGNIIRIYQKAEELVKENSRSFLLCLLESNCRKVCFEAQAFIMFVLELLNENDRTSYDWLLLDPLVGVWLLNPDHPPHSFDCVLKEFNVKVESCNKSSEWMDTVCNYMDAQSKVMGKLYAELSRLNLWDVFYRMETPLASILAAMERRSIEVNYGRLKDISKVLQEKLNSVEQSAWATVGKKFQLSSPSQLRSILYDELKLHEIGGVTIKTTAGSGAKSTDEGMLKLLLGVHPLPALILEYRHTHKIKSTYIDGILAHVVDNTSVSTTWEQCAAATGRITSSSPNLQSIPKQEENLKTGGECFNVREIFVSRHERVFVAADFQQIELRVFAHLSEDEILISALREPGDIFEAMTRIRIGKRDFEPSERDKTKTLMYAQLYGAGAHKISELLSVGMEHAIRICSDFYAAFPGLKSFRASILQVCRAQKELRSLSGRRRLLPNIAAPFVQQKRYAERQAVNFVIQGSAADVCKAAMLKAEAALKEGDVQASLLLQIHDELLWEVHEKHVLRATEIIKRAIEDTKDYWSEKFNMKVHLPVKITSGKSWGAMKAETEPRT